MCLLITGAQGFIGRAVARRLSTMEAVGDVRLVDRRLPTADHRFECRQVDLRDRHELESALQGVTRVVHLASLAGGAAEADPAASRAINLDASLNLMEALAGSAHRARFVYASSIAVFGALSPTAVDDDTLPVPALTYGTHKLMVEHAVADATRRLQIDGISLRLPGIVARPAGDVRLKSAFMSEIFWAIQSGLPYELPVAPSATMWLLSIAACVTALLHAAFAHFPAPLNRAITLPALRVTMAELVAEIATATARRTTHVTYRPDPGLSANFGAYPPLCTETADRLGFRHDGNLARLVFSAVEPVTLE